MTPGSDRQLNHLPETTQRTGSKLCKHLEWHFPSPHSGAGMLMLRRVGYCTHMDVLDRFDAAFDKLGDTPLGAPELFGSRLSAAAADAAAAAGAGLGMFTRLIRVPIGASDLHASVAERLQFTTGEGPCITSHHDQQPVIADDQVLQTWPTYRTEILRRTPYRLIASFPLAGASFLGNLDLYYTTTQQNRIPPLPTINELTAKISELLFTQPLIESATGSTAPAWMDNPFGVARNRVVVAIGMLTTALHIDFAEALARLRARAYSNDQTIDDLAAALINQQITTDQPDWQ